MNGEDRYIQNRVNLPTSKSSAEISRDIPAQIRARAFFSARVAEAHILDRFRQITDDYNTGRIGRDEARNLMMEYARQHGRDDGTRGMKNLASTARLNLIIDQNAKMAHAVGEHERMYSPAALKLFPYVRYHASVGSKKPRSGHQKFDGMIFEKTDPWLTTHTPPWEFGCNCRLEQITAKQAGKTPDLIQEPTPADKVTVDSKSGFQFDPAHAFEKFDLTSIKNEARRGNVAEQLENRFGMSISPDGKYASVSTDTTKIEMPPTKAGEKVNEAISGLTKSKHIGTVNFSGMPEKAAENTGKAAARLTQCADEYGLDITYVGTRFGSESGPKYLAPGTVFETREENGRTEFIFNEKLLADPTLASKMEDAVNNGYHPKGINSVAAYADHDIAHLLFYKAKMDQDEKFMRFIRFLRNRPDFVREQISGYAEYFAILSESDEKFAQEALAECWASVRNAEDPPILHKILANALEKRLKGK